MRYKTAGYVIGTILCLTSMIVGCTGTTPESKQTSIPPPTASTPGTVTSGTSAIFQQWLTKAKGIQSSQTNYNFRVEFDIGSAARVTDIEGMSYVKDERSMDEMKVSRAQGVTTERQYVIGKDLYVASKVEKDWIVKRQSTISPPGVWDVLMTWEGLLDKGALAFQDEVRDRSIAGRTGNEIRISVDISKLSQKERYFLLAQGAMAFLGQQEAVFASAMQACEVVMTVVPADGLQLASEIRLSLDKTLLPENSPYSTKVSMTATDIKVNVSIPEDILALPNAPSTPSSSIMTMIAGEEDTAEPAIHIVALNVARPNTNHIKQTVQGRIDEINAQGGLAIIAHPNIRGYTNEEQLKALKGYLGMEVYFRWNENAFARWDAVLTDRVAKDEPLVWGFMTDDAHEVNTYGKGFIILQAGELSKSTILEALQKGSFYWGNADLIKDISVNGNTIDISLGSEASVKFIKQGGQIIKTVQGTSAQYSVNGDEGYVRIEVESTDGKTAGTQPFRIKGTSNISNPYATDGKWYKGNLHCHTTRSDGALSPTEAMKWYEDDGYSFLALTDHVSWEIPVESTGSISGRIDYKGALNVTSTSLVYPIALWQASPVSFTYFTFNGPGSYTYTIPYLPDGTYYGVAAGILSKNASGNTPFKPGDILAVGYYGEQIGITGQNGAKEINFSVVDCLGSISGNINHGGTAIPNQSNTPLCIWVGYQPNEQSPFFRMYFITTRLGFYTIPYVPDGRVTLSAWLDVDNDGNTDLDEPQFKSEEIVISGSGSVQSINLTLK